MEERERERELEMQELKKITEENEEESDLKLHRFCALSGLLLALLCSTKKMEE